MPGKQVGGEGDVLECFGKIFISLNWSGISPFKVIISVENPKPYFYLIVLQGGEGLPVSVEIKIILGYNMLNLSKAISLGYTCLKVKPVVGGCFRNVTVPLLLYSL